MRLQRTASRRSRRGPRKLGAACAATLAIGVLGCAGGALVGAGGALASPVGGFSGSLQGNPQAIQIAARVQRTFAGLPAYSYSERGFFQISSSPGKTPDISYYYGYGGLHAGFVWAAENGTVDLRGGEVVWWRDDLTPLGGGDRQTAVELVSDSQGTFAAIGDAAHHSCYTAVEGSVPFVYGEPAYSADGRYRGTSPLTSVYIWDTGQRASESDVVSSSYLIRSGTVTVHPGAGLPGFSFAFDNAYPDGAGAPPKIDLCSPLGRSGG